MANNVKLMDTYYYCIGGSMILTFGSVDLFGGNPTRDGGLTQNTVVSWEAQLPLLDKIRSELTKVFFFWHFFGTSTSTRALKSVVRNDSPD